MAGRSGAIRAGRAFVGLYADNNPLARDLREATAKLRRFASTARAIGQSIATTGLKFAAPFALATAVFVGFEDQMAEVRAVTQASAKDFAALTKQAERLGRTTSFMAKEVAGAQTELGRAGFNPSQITSATASILSLARGTKTELAQAAQIGADSLRAFRLEAAQMPRVADVLVATANNSSQGLTDLFEALKTVGPVAADVGASIEDTAAAIGVLANNGIKGTLAGNAMKRAYLNLANPTIRKKIEALTKVSAVDSAGNLRPLASVITDIGKATAGLPNSKRLDIFAQIFGDRAVVAASAFAGSAGNFRDLQGVLDGAAGTAKRTADVMDNTLGGSFRKLMSAVEGVGLTIGKTIAPAVRSIADILTAAAGHVTAFVKANQKLVIGLALGSVAAIAMGVGLLAVGSAVGVLAMGLSGLASVASGAFGTLPGLFRAITSPAKMATAAVLALAVASGLAPKASAATPAGTQTAAAPPAAAAGMDGIKDSARSAAAAVLPLAGSFAGLRATQGIVGGVVSSLGAIPAASRRVTKSMVANSTAARRLGTSIGVVSNATGRTFARATRIAHGPLRALTAASVSTSGVLTKTSGILIGKVASGFDVAAASMGGASRKLSTAGRSVALASSALTRTVGRASKATLAFGRTARIVSFDVLGFASSMARAAAVRAVSGLKATTQAMGGLAISAFRATRGMIAAAASITAANVAAAAATGFRTAAGGMRLLSMGALKASIGLKAVGKSIRSTMVLARVGGIATAAVGAISTAAAGLFALVTSPVALFAGLAAGAVAAFVYAAGSVDILTGGLRSMAGAAGAAFGSLARQAGTAWQGISTTGGRAIGGIVAAIKAGNMQGAFRIATTGIALMWSQVVTSFVDTWAPVKVALVSGWQETSRLFGSIFGGAVAFVRNTFAGFASWFSSDNGAGSMPATIADAVASMSELMATGWSVIKSGAGDAMDILADGWDTYVAKITNAWSTAIGFIQKGWTRLKAMFDSDIDVEAEVRNIDRANNAGNESRDAERDRKISERAAKNKAAKEKSKQYLQDQLAGIEETRKRKNAEAKAAIAAEKENATKQAEARKKAFDEAMTAADPVAAAADTGTPAAAAVAAKPGVDPVTGKTAAELVQEWKQARTERDKLKAELSGANRNKGVNPNTGRSKEEIQKDYNAAGNKVSGAIAGVGRASATNESSGSTEFGLPQAPTAAEQRKQAKAMAEAFGGEKKKFERNEKGQLLDPDSGRPITEVLDDDKKAATAAQGAKVSGSGAALTRTEGRLAGSLGSFSARAAAQSGAGSVVMNRIAEATKTTADAATATATNTEAIANGIDDLAGLEAE